MTSLGAHITGGPRNGYGEFAAANPRICCAVNEGGALVEAKEKSAGHTVTIFRDTTVYLEAPGDINNKRPDVTWAEFAAYWWPRLSNKWAQNPADYYTITNEQGGNDPRSIENLVNYEREIMKLANATGYKVCVLNLAGGSPGDFQMWQELLAPFIIEAWQAGNIYGRHVYGGDLVHQGGRILGGQPERPIEEVTWLNSQGHYGGLAITECGLDGGFGFAGIDRFFKQMTGYEQELRFYSDIIGICMWNLGNWQAADANWSAAIPRFVEYMEANPTPAWQPGEPPPPPPPPDKSLEQRIWDTSLEAQTISLGPSALQDEIKRRDYWAVGNETRLPDDNSVILRPAENPLTGDRRVAWVVDGQWYDVHWLAEPDDQPPPPPPPDKDYDLAEYMRGDGMMYEVKHANGSQETFQSQREGSYKFYQVKNQQYEELWVGSDHIWRGLDTSPGPAPHYAERPDKPRYYRQFNSGEAMARWCPRYMSVGDTWTSGWSHSVQFHYKSDCAKSAANSGSGLYNATKLVAHHDTFTTDQGGTVSDVLELEANGERFFYGRGWGLIAWGHPESESGSKASGFTGEVHSGRPDLERETGCFS